MKKIFPFIWLLAFAAALMPFAAYEAQGFMLAFVLVAVGLSFVVLKADLPQQIHPLHAVFLIPVFAFWGLAGLSAVLSDAPYVSLIYFCFFSLFPLSLFCSMAARNKAQFFGVIAGGLAVIFAALSVWSIIQFFTGSSLLVFGRTHWPFADPNSLGGFLNLGLFGSIGLMIAAKNRLQSNAGLILGAIIFAALLTTGSRGAIVALAVALTVFAVLCWAQFKHHKRCSILLGIAAAISVFAMRFHADPVAGSVAGRMVDTVSGQMPVLWDRPAQWASAWQIMKQHFWSGTGIGTYYLYYPEVRDGDVHSAGRVAHSDLVQFGVELGVFGPILFYAFIGVVIYLSVRALKKLPKNDVRRVHIAVPLCAMAAFVAHTHINFHFNILPLLMMAGVVTGYWFWQVRGVIGDEIAGIKSLRLPGQQMLKIILIVPLLAVTYVFTMQQSSAIVFALGDAKGQRGDMAGFTRDLNIADRMAQHRNAQALVMAARIQLAGLQNLRGITQPNSQAVHDEAQELLRRAEDLNGRMVTVPHTRAGLAHVAALLGLTGTNSQQQELEAAVRMNPLYYPARIDLADYYKRKGPKDKVLPTLKDGLKWEYAAIVPPEFYARLAREAVQAGDADTAEIAKKKLESYGIDYETLR